MIRNMPAVLLIMFQTSILSYAAQTSEIKEEPLTQYKITNRYHEEFCSAVQSQDELFDQGPLIATYVGIFDQKAVDDEETSYDIDNNETWLQEKLALKPEEQIQVWGLMIRAKSADVMKKLCFVSHLNIEGNNFTDKDVPQQGLSVLHIWGHNFTDKAIPQQGLSALKIVGDKFTDKAIPQRGLSVLHIWGHNFTDKAIPQRGLSALKIEGDKFTDKAIPQQGLSVLDIYGQNFTDNAIPQRGLSVLKIRGHNFTDKAVPQL